MAEEWIFEENLKAFLNVLAADCGAEVGSDDWVAISYGVKDTDVEHGRWFDYELVGSRCKVCFAIAHDVGSSVVYIRMTAPPPIAGLGMLFLACQTYRLVSRGTQ